jgi:hypothetical protein
VELGAGIPFASGKYLQAALDTAGVPAKTAAPIVDENVNVRINGLRASLSLLAAVVLIALFASRRIPAQQPSAPAWRRTRDLRVGPMQGTPSAVAFRATSSNLLPVGHSWGPR